MDSHPAASDDDDADTSGEEVSPAPRRTPNARGRAVYWSTLTLFVVVLGGWALATPLMAATGEPSNVVKAAAVVRADLMPDPIGNGLGGATVPSLIAQATTLPTCYAGRPQQNADCAPALTGDLSADAHAATDAARANPAYFAVVGIPTLVSSSVATVYAMRLLSALLVAIFAAATVRTLAELPGSRWPVWGTAIAITPMALFLGGTVDPRAVEVMAAIAVWVTAAALLRHPDPGGQGRLLTRFTVASVAVANSAGLGPVLILLIVLLSAWAAPPGAVGRLLHAKHARSHLRVCVAGWLLAVVWLVLAATRPYGLPEVSSAPGGRATLRLTSVFLTELIGVFGWSDTALPGWLYYLWFALLGALLLFGLAVAFRRQQWAILAIGATVVGLPVAVSMVDRGGMIWHGHYALPIAAGLPIVAAFLLRDARIPAMVTRRVTGIGLSLVIVGYFVAFAVNLRRFTVGDQGSWRALDGGWPPPLSPYVLLAVEAVALIVLVSLLHRRVGSEDPSVT